eukprot:2901359-Pyramimonas_sp.AAC.1
MSCATAHLPMFVSVPAHQMFAELRCGALSRNAVRFARYIREHWFVRSAVPRRRSLNNGVAACIARDYP